MVFLVKHPLFFPKGGKFDGFQFTSLCNLPFKKWSARKGGDSIRNATFSIKEYRYSALLLRSCGYASLTASIYTKKKKKKKTGCF